MSSLVITVVLWSRSKTLQHTSVLQSRWVVVVVVNGCLRLLTLEFARLYCCGTTKKQMLDTGWTADTSFLQQKTRRSRTAGCNIPEVATATASSIATKVSIGFPARMWPWTCARFYNLLSLATGVPNSRYYKRRTSRLRVFTPVSMATLSRLSLTEGGLFGIPTFTHSTLN